MDFSLILFIAMVATGGAWWGYRLLQKRGVIEERETPPTVIEYARTLFPVILAVFVLRSFVVEPFRIPSGSMLPTLRVGDFILVNKFTYGIRLPLLNKQIIALGEPARGDVMVFRYPLDRRLNFIKRVVGLPGDRIAYKNKQLSVNGVTAGRVETGEYIFRRGVLAGHAARQFNEQLGDKTYAIAHDPRGAARDLNEVTVPDGHYFVMGDNRDHSNDSRYWRFVPEENILGRAFLIWFTISGEWSRIGDVIK